jgi:hypothetical protein
MNWLSKLMGKDEVNTTTNDGVFSINGKVYPITSASNVEYLTSASFIPTSASAITSNIESINYEWGLDVTCMGDSERVFMRVPSTHNKTEQKPITWRCAYCGSSQLQDRIKCSQCGAQRFN